MKPYHVLVSHGTQQIPPLEVTCTHMGGSDFVLFHRYYRELQSKSILAVTPAVCVSSKTCDLGKSLSLHFFICNTEVGSAISQGGCCEDSVNSCPAHEQCSIFKLLLSKDEQQGWGWGHFTFLSISGLSIICRSINVVLHSQIRQVR